MMRLIRSVSAFTVSLLLAGCATQNITVVRKLEVKECPRWVVTFPAQSEQAIEAITREVMLFSVKLQRYCK